MGKKRNRHLASRISYFKKALFLAMLFLFVVLPIVGVSADSIWQKQQELNNLQNRIDQYQSKIDRTKGEISSLKGQIGSLNDQIGRIRLEIKKIRLEIDETNMEISETNNKIIEKKKELKKQKEVLGEAIKYLYEEGETPFVETFFSSTTFSEILDRTEYLNTAEYKIEKTMEKIEAIKADLEAKKEKIEKERDRLVKLKKEQNNELATLNQQQLIKRNILQVTQNKESLYQQKLSSLAQRQQAIIRWIGAHISYSNGCESSCGSQIYCQPQCVTYVARIVGVSYGNGGDWAAYGDFRTPKPGDVMSWPAYTGGAGRFGHVAYVESVSGSRGDPMITVSQTNWGCNCCRSTMSFHKSAFPAARYIHF